MAYTGLNAVVTGGASPVGIGRALCELLLDGGANVFIGDTNVSDGETYVKESEKKRGPGRVAFRQLDVADWRAVHAFFLAVETHFQAKGGLDLCFPNAGIAKPGFPDIPVSASVAPDMSMVNINYIGVLYTVQAAVDLMRKKPDFTSGSSGDASSLFRYAHRGKIVISASVTGLHATPCHVIYASTKAAVISAARALGPRLAQDKISVNVVCPNLAVTAASPGDFYKTGEKHGVIVPMKTVMDAFEMCLKEDITGQAVEAGDGAHVHKFEEPRDEFTRKSFEVLYPPRGPAETSRVPVLVEAAKAKIAAAGESA